jgi:hypothetical protein
MNLVEVGVGNEKTLQLFLDNEWSVVVTLEGEEEAGEVTRGLGIIPGLRVSPQPHSLFNQHRLHPL